MSNVLSLNGIWKMKRTDESRWLDAAVPGCCVGTLFEHSLIPDPFYRENEKPVKACFDYDYEFRRSFTVESALLENDRVKLVFEGLDTLAEVMLNGMLILKADNMHRTWRVDVKNTLHPGENEISILFRSPNRYVAERIARADVNFPAGGSMAGNNYIRKAHSMFGWDWGPQLPNCGIWRNVYIEASSGPRICDLYPVQHHENGCVTVDVQVKLEYVGPADDCSVHALLTAPGGKTYAAKSAIVQAGSDLKILVEDPQLWWPNGLGEHPLYDLTVTLWAGERVLDTRSLRIGLRTIRLCQAVDADGQGAEFAFEVNGYKFFATGSNYIPEDSFLSRITPERTRKLVADCAWANYNMIRVWGGGYYPADDFFDACDEYGILVWQDLMFACNVYELDDAFEETTTAEVIDNVRRIRHHACLALWCGNNEIEWGWQEWFPILTPSVARRNDYTVMFEYLYKKLVQKYDPATEYKASSPSSNYQMIGSSTTNDHLPNSYHVGDTHYYDVWLHRAPMEDYRKNRFRFLSEFSFQSLPNMKTLRSVTEAEDWDIFSPVMDARQKNDLGNGLILHYLAATYRYPKDFESLIYVTQLMQAYAVPYAIEHMRRNRPYSMGTLYWQLNDVWPAISWSSVDYYGRYKALHYLVRHAYAPFTASILDEGTSMAVYVENETREAKSYRLVCAVKDMHNRILFEEEVSGISQPFTAVCAFSRDFRELVSAMERAAYFTYRLYEEDRFLYEDAAFFVKIKHVELPEVMIRTEISETEDAFEISLASDGFAYRVMLDLKEHDAVFSENYFCLTGAPCTIQVQKKDLSAPLTLREFMDELTIFSLRDSY